MGDENQPAQTGAVAVEATSFTLSLEQQEDYQFVVKFDWPQVDDLLLDEPPPLGGGAGPNAARLVAAAAANCLSASLLFCMQKFKQKPGKITTTVNGVLARNERGRLRVGELNVAIQLAESGEQIAHLDRCIAQFEDYCVVTDSIRHGIPVHVKVLDGAGKVLLQN